MGPLLAMAACVLADWASAYPIEPQPLRKLYRDAELVAVVTAGASTPLNDLEAKVVLSIQKLLKGTPRADELWVYHEPGMRCPAPDRYPVGRTLLVFLKWSEQLKGYFAPGLSYGSRLLDGPTLALYVKRLEELAGIPAEKPGEDPSAETVEWLVRCIENPLTRWEGAYEFEPAGEGEEKRRVIPTSRLSKGQLQRLTDAFVVPRTFDADDVLLMNMLKGVGDDRIATFLATEVRYAVAIGELGWVEWIIPPLAHRLGIEGGEDFVARLHKEDEDAVEVVRQFLELVEKK